MTLQPPNLSVVVLAYQSASTISSFVQKLSSSLDRNEPDWEIILVGNYISGSDDKTPNVVRELASHHPRIRSVTRVKEGMMGWDMKTGLQAATGRTLAVIDGDGQMPCEDVIRVYQKLKEEKLGLVKTYRTQRGDGTYRKFISVAYNIMFKLLFPGLHCQDMNSKPKVMTREVYENMELQSDGWFIDAEIMIQARRMKLKVGDVPTVFHRIDYRPSFVKINAVLEFLFNLLWYRVLEFGRNSKPLGERKSCKKIRLFSSQKAS